MGIYVGFATVGVFAAWYMFGSLLGVRLDGDGHTPITWHQLTHWEQCPQWTDFHVSPSKTRAHIGNAQHLPGDWAAQKFLGAFLKTKKNSETSSFSSSSSKTKRSLLGASALSMAAAVNSDAVSLLEGFPLFAHV